MSKPFKADLHTSISREVLVMRKNVFIDPRCLITSLIPSALEEYHKEISGYLIGSNGKKATKLKIAGAYPMQTDNKNRTWVEHGNESAVRRVDELVRTLQMKLVGGFHSHPKGPSYLSRDDVQFIREKLDAHKLRNWLELLVSVKKKDYLHPHAQGWFLKEFTNKIGFIIRTDPWTGFGVTLSGYWIRSEGPRKEARLWTSRRQNF